MTRSPVKRKPRILVVDDDANILSAFRDYLRTKNCIMVGVSDVELAFNMVMKRYFDLLITDIRLNFQSGVTFLLRAKEARPNLPVIVITGYPDIVTKNDLKTYGASHILMKPLELDQLNKAIDHCLGWHDGKTSIA
ncbi:MAG: response regulator [Bacteroidetes bacterium]|jgi:two-component system response regulator HydG|nr:response regulator [Bacteroidota bacterium]